MMQVLEGNIPNHYKHALQRMPLSPKKTWYTQTVLNLKWCWNLLTEGARIEGLFQTITALCSKILQSFKGNAQSQATLSERNSTFFEK